MTLKRLAAKITLKTHIWSYCLMKRVEQCYFKALKTGFVENKGQSGPLSADSETQEANVSSQLNFRPFVSCQLTLSRPSRIFSHKMFLYAKYDNMTSV